MDFRRSVLGEWGVFSLCASISFVLVAVSSGAVVPLKSGRTVSVKRGYAVLQCAASTEEAAVHDALSPLGLEGVASESTAVFFLNTWSGVESVPLGTLDRRLVEQDPRRDGYAEKLRGFFVNGEKRRFFIPLAGQKVVSGKLEEAVRKALPEAEIYVPTAPVFQSGAGRALFSTAIMFLLAAYLMFSVFWGRSFVKNFLAERFYKKAGGGNVSALNKKAALPIVISGAAFFVCAVLGGIKPYFAILPLLPGAIFAALPLFLKSEGRRWGVNFFMPVPIIRNSVEGAYNLFRRKRFFLMPLFFIAAALVISFILMINNGAPGAESYAIPSFASIYENIVEKEEYDEHIKTQTLFSYNSLGAHSSNTENYLRYKEDADGFYIADGSALPEAALKAALENFPPYPYSGIASFMKNGFIFDTAKENFGGSFFILQALSIVFIINVLFCRKIKLYKYSIQRRNYA